MQITQQCVAGIHYTLKNDEGEIVDSSQGQEPLFYLHGAQNIVPGLESVLDGKTVGDKITVVVGPEEGYGEYDATLVQQLPSSMFAGVDKIEVGMEFQAETQHGMQVIAVTHVEDDTVTVDGNHPLAGQNLHFDVEVTEVREATADELEHGHVHGPGCDH